MRRCVQAYAEVEALLSRNLAALDALTHELLQPPGRLDGADVRAIVKQHANADDWRRSVEEASDWC